MTGMGYAPLGGGLSGVFLMGVMSVVPLGMFLAVHF